jgi:hypothetical protein
VGFELIAEYCPTRTPAMLRVTMERLVSELELANQQAWLDADLDRDELRIRLGLAMQLATEALDSLQPS